MRVRLTPGVSRDQLGDTVRGPVADAIERVPRHAFLPEERRMTAYLDRSVPLGHGRRCPRPSVVARMLDPVASASRVLVVGAGTGYVAACAAALGAEVIAVETEPELLDRAARSLGALRGGGDVKLRQAMPPQAALEAAPYDAIVICGAIERTPRRMLAALNEDGVVVVPIRQNGGAPTLMSYQAGKRGHLRRDLGTVEIEALPQPTADAC